jgi:hypothetical protein
VYLILGVGLFYTISGSDSADGVSSFQAVAMSVESQAKIPESSTNRMPSEKAGKASKVLE